MRWSHLPVEYYAGIAGQSDERCRTLARRPGGSRHLCGFGVRSKLRGEVEDVSGSANKQRRKCLSVFQSAKTPSRLTPASLAARSLKLYVAPGSRLPTVHCSSEPW